MASLRVENLTKNFQDSVVLDGVGLSVAAGEMVFLLGPSGAGKTTLLRAISGQLVPEAGRIWVGGADVTATPAPQRRVGFAGPAVPLWPHLSVRENVAFGLGQLRWAEEDIRQGVHAALAAVSLDSAGERRPAELSGGQQQRAALARALAPGPAVLLLDEPFSALEERARRELFALVRRECREAGLAVLCATQNQDDALAWADAVAVLLAGQIQQVSPPLELYRRPRTRFVAEFVGGANVLPGTVTHAGAGEFIATTPLGEVRGALADPENEPEPGAALDVVIRPEALHLDLMAPEENVFSGTVTDGTDYFGGTAGLLFQTTGGTVLRITEPNPRTNDPAGGAPLFAWAAPEDVVGIRRE